MSRHSFEPEIATQVGVNAAVIYQNIVWWCERNAVKGRNIKDGNAWTFNSVSNFEKLFGYFTAKQIRTALDKLEESGLLVVGNYNEDQRDRTKWYSLNTNSRAFAQNVMGHLPKRAETLAQKGRPLPDSKPDSKPDVKEDTDVSSKKTTSPDLFSADAEPQNTEVSIVGQALPAEKAGKPKAKTKGSRLSNDWKLPRDWGEWAVSEGWPPNAVREEAEKFRDYWISKSGSAATKLDWQATWRNWMRNSKTQKTNGANNDRQRTEDPALANIARLAGLT